MCVCVNLYKKEEEEEYKLVSNFPPSPFIF